MNGRLRRFARSFWLPTITSVVSFVVGTVAGPTIEKLIDVGFFDTAEGTILFLLAVLILTVAASVIIASALVNKAEKRERKWLEELAKVKDQIGLTVEFIEDPVQHSTGAFHSRARELVEQAQESILVLDHGILGKSRELDAIRSPEDKASQREYCAALIAKAEKNRNVPRFYKRICQFDDGKGHFTLDWKSKEWIEHYRTIMDLQERYGCAELRVARTFFPENVLIVDEKHIMLVVDTYDYERGMERRYGTLYFYDPSQKVVKTLQSVVTRLELDPKLSGDPPQQWEWNE
jgi:hypothetical protein